MEDGLLVEQLAHLKCRACKAQFFDDEAMRRIQAERNKQQVTGSV